jgi:hypothetical protein
MSTFLPGGQILLRCRRRFLIFSSNGNFIDEVKFNDEALLNAPPSESENALKDKEDVSDDGAEGEPKQSKINAMPRQKQFTVLNFKDEPYFPRLEAPRLALSELNKMELLQFSYNNQYFLFFNRMTEKFLLYELGKVAFVEEEGVLTDLKPPTGTQEKW